VILALDIYRGPNLFESAFLRETTLYFQRETSANLASLDVRYIER
jgi:hypothetical protein